MDASIIPQGVLTLKSRVRRLYLCWWTTHYAIGFLGVFAGALLTALTSAGDLASTESSPLLSLANFKAHAWLIGIVAAVCTSLVTFLGPIGKAERYWSAYHLLDHACLEFEQGLIGKRRFVARVKAARAILQAGGINEDGTADAMREIERESADGARPPPTELKQAA